MLVVLFPFTVPPITGIALTGYFIVPKTIWHQVNTGNSIFGVKAGIIGVPIYMLITSIFIRHAFYKYFCAAGLMQMLFGWISPVSLRMKFDRDDLSRCTDCKGFESACFMDVRPRQAKRNVISCVNCGGCITACRRELGDKCLFSYQFGKDRLADKTDRIC